MLLKYTTVYEEGRQIMGITRDEYALCNLIYMYCAYRMATRAGWCDLTNQQKADFIGITPKGLKKMQDRLCQASILEKDLNSNYYRTTQIWFQLIVSGKNNDFADFEKKYSKIEGGKMPDHIILGEQSSSLDGTLFPLDGTLFPSEGNFVPQNMPLDGNKVPPSNNSISKLNENKSNKKNKDIDEFSILCVTYLNEKLGEEIYFPSSIVYDRLLREIKKTSSVEDVKAVIDYKFHTWGKDPKMVGYLRPETLFGNKFPSYNLQAKQWLKIKNEQLENGTDEKFSGAF